MSPRVRRVLVIVVGVALFGLVMGFRSEVQSRWARISVAGLAGGIMGLTIVMARRRP